MQKSLFSFGFHNRVSNKKRKGDEEESEGDIENTEGHDVQGSKKRTRKFLEVWKAEFPMQEKPHLGRYL